MKTLFSILFTLMLTVAAISTDAYRPDGGDWFTAAAVAVLFGFALNDGRRPRRLGLRAM
ncbi:MAG: hypothetical protein WC485_03765 [Opitutaceae bacterium]